MVIVIAFLTVTMTVIVFALVIGHIVSVLLLLQIDPHYLGIAAQGSFDPRY